MVEYRQALPEGFVLAGDYRIHGVLGQGGFGITYRAEDLRLHSPVAIKEYFPSELAVRDEGSTVEPRSVRDQGVLEWGRAKFVEEARTLARFRHPSIVRVARFFETNNTAYMVLDFEMGPNLAEWRARLGCEPSQAEVDAIAAKLLDAVGAVHDAGILHRDIKPANIIMRDGVEPVLIDFGAARQALSAQSKTVHAIVTPGYSPKEQYAVDLDRQGPWSDIYALGATLYYLVTGRQPSDALSRELGDDMRSAASMGGGWRPGFLHAIDRAMRIDAAARPQTTAEWREMLFALTPAKGAPERETAIGATPVTSRPVPSAALPSARSAIASVSTSPSTSASVPRRLSFDDLPDANANSVTATRRRGGIAFASGLTGLLVLGALGYWIFVEVPARDEAAWQRAASANTIAAFEEYVAGQPSGRHVADARNRQAEIRERTSRAASAGGSSSGVSASAGAATPSDRPTAAPSAAATGNPAPAPTPQASVAEPVSETTPTGPPGASGTGDGGAAPPPQNPLATTPKPARQQASTRVASTAPVAGRAEVPANTPAPGPSGSGETGRFRPRPALPEALADDEIVRLAAAVPRGTWRLADFAAENVSGFSEQSGDFVGELQRVAAGKLDFARLAEDRGVPIADLLQRITTRRDLIAWQAPFTQSGRHPEFAIFSGAVPFGLPPSDHVRWLRADGGRLLEQAFVDIGAPMRAVPCGIAGGVGAWFKKEVRSPADFRGLKVRAPRLMGGALTKLGAEIVALPSTRELAAAFAADRVEANFGVTPLTEIFLAQSRPAAVYHYPGVHNPAYLFTLLIGPDTWSDMAEPQQRLIDEACRRNLDRWAQHFPTTQGEALDRIRRQRIVVRPFTGPLREALRKAIDQVLAEEAVKSPSFKEVLESYNRFRS
ncbi:MAG: protein kinase [Hyphomicrobiaceae bacterium]